MPFCFFNAFYTAFRRFFSLLFFLLFLIFLINFYFPHFCRSISLIRFVSLNASAFHPYVLFFYFLYIIPFFNLNSFLHFFLSRLQINNLLLEICVAFFSGPSFETYRQLFSLLFLSCSLRIDFYLSTFRKSVTRRTERDEAR